MLPQSAQDLDVALEGQPWRDGAVAADLEVGQLPEPPLLRPVRRALLEPGADVLDGCAEQARRCHDGPSVLPVGEALPELDQAAIDARDAGDGERMTVRQLEHDVAAPRLAGDHRLGPTEVLDQQPQIVGDGAHVEAVVRLGRVTVPALIDGHDRMPLLRETPRDPVPQARVGRETMDEQPRSQQRRGA